MLIPRFYLSQDPKTLTITVLARYCKLSDLEVEAYDDCFLFSCSPYYLRLTLPGNIVDNNNTRASYHSDTGEFIFRYDKAVEGEEFEDLDLITKFLVKKVDASYGFEADDEKITVLSGDNVEEEVLCTGLKDCLTFGFGFGLQGGAHFKSLYSEYFDIFQVDPYQVCLKDRRRLRLKKEKVKFDSEHYLCDLLDFEEIEQIIGQITPWQNIDVSTLTFTTKELDFLKDLHNKVYKLSSVQVNYVHNTLIDILYAYCYNQRVNSYEENSESGWNILTLSASLSWLDVFETSKEALVFAFRRSLIYPLYRNFVLSLKVFEDLKLLLSLGEKFIIKCLIDVYYIFLNGDSCRYVLNNLFIKDYINYVMKWDKNTWEGYLQCFYKEDVKKSDLGLNLLEIEQRVQLEESMARLDITGGDGDNTSDSDDSLEIDSIPEVVESVKET